MGGSDSTGTPPIHTVARYLEARKAVQQLDRRGIYTYRINLDPRADGYVQDIVGKQYTVVDRAERLPEKLPQLFLSLTK